MKRVGAAYLVAGAVLGSVAIAGEPVAIVEEVQGNVVGVQPLAFLAAGTEIRLPAGATLVLGYLRSCAHETIEGGRIVIGAEESRVDGGNVLRETVERDGGRLRLTPEQGMTSAVMPIREMPKSAAPQTKVFGTSPVFLLSAPERVRIERLDAPVEPLELTADALGALAVLDLERQDHRLAPGGVYRVTAGGREGVFAVAASAKPSPIAIVSRVLRLE